MNTKLYDACLKAAIADFDGIKGRKKITNDDIKRAIEIYKLVENENLTPEYHEKDIIVHFNSTFDNQREMSGV
jgi:hypothetical protein